jgi:hypothetical protein
VKLTNTGGGEGEDEGEGREGKAIGSVLGLMNEGTKEEADALRGRAGEEHSK